MEKTKPEKLLEVLEASGSSAIYIDAKRGEIGLTTYHKPNETQYFSYDTYAEKMEIYFVMKSLGLKKIERVNKSLRCLDVDGREINVPTTKLKAINEFIFS